MSLTSQRPRAPQQPRSLGLRFATCVLALAISLAPGLLAQRPTKKAPTKKASVESFGNHRGTFSLVRDLARAHKWSQAKKFLAQGRGEAAVEELLEVLKTSPATVLDIDGDRYVGLKVLARESLASLPSKVRAVYQQRISREAKSLLDSALAKAQPKQLIGLAERFPHSGESAQALLAAGDLYLERGQVVRALETYAALSRKPQDQALWTRFLLARRLLGLPIAASRLPSELPALLWNGEEKTPADWLSLSKALRPQPLREAWKSFGGGLSNSRFAPEPKQPWEEAWQQPLVRLNSILRAWQPVSDLFPVSDGRMIFVNTGNSIYGLDGYSSRGWVFEGPLHYDNDALSFMNSVSVHSTHSASTSEGILVAPMQVPIASDAASGNRSFRGIPIMSRLPVRRLYALEAETGRLRWSHWAADGRMPKGLDEAAIDVSGPPMIVGDTVFVATHKQLGTIALYLSAFDLKTGALRWSTLVCSSQVEVNMFGNASVEHLASPLAYDDGVIYGSSNLGVLYALDARDGAIRWLRAYDIIPIPPAQMHTRQRPVYWGNNPPLLSEGLVIFTPLDSRDAIAVEQENAKLLWKTSHQLSSGVRSRYQRSNGPRLRWLLGVSGGKAYFQGQCLATVPLRPRISGGRVFAKALVSAESMGQENLDPSANSIPRGLMTKRWIYHLTPFGRLLKIDHDGRIVQASRSRLSPSQIGTLLSAGGILYAASRSKITSYFSRRDLLRIAAQRVRKQPKNPVLLLELAEIWAADKSKTLLELGRTVELFEQATQLFREQAVPSEAAARAEFGRFRLRLELARKRFELDPRKACQNYQQAISAGIELFAKREKDARLQRELLRLFGEAASRFPDDLQLRQIVLRQLETVHRQARHLFPGKGHMPGGLFACLLRLEKLGDSEEDARKRIELLHLILRSYSGEQIDSTPSRAFALAQMRRLLDRFGQKLYAPFEAEAQQLLVGAAEDGTRLRSILDRYPLSTAAREALLQLAAQAAQTNDLAKCLTALHLAAKRLPEIPEQLLKHVGSIAAKRGNARLARAFDNNCPPIEDALIRREGFSGTPKRLSAKVQLLGFLRTPHLEKPRVVSGFPQPKEKAPILLSDGETLQAFADPQAGRTTMRERWRVAHKRHMLQIRPILCGETLVLVEDRRVLGLSIGTGRVQWEFDLAADYGESCEITACAPLDSGLIGILLSSYAEEDARHSIFGVEPLTGTTLFERNLTGHRAPRLRAGRIFRLLSPGSDQAQYASLELYDSKLGQLQRRIRFGEDGRPGFRRLSDEKLLVADDGIYVFSRNRSGLTAPGFYALDFSGKERWHFKLPASQQLGPDDGFVLSGPLALLLLGVHHPDASLLFRLNRASGRAMKAVECGSQAFFLHDPSTRAQLFPAGPLLILSSESGGRPQVLQIDSRVGGSSWMSPLPTWAPEDLGLVLRRHSGASLLGTETLALARARIPRRTRDRQVEITLLIGASGHVAPAPALKSLPWQGALQLASRGPQLVVNLGTELRFYSAKD
ncbi:MAG: hypothetical protein CSA62_10215 [Planctomycetota bacterium]|nr:MAG: hypothetical protein CSA62_10215 [Planctomycetota bacterium]